MLLCPLLALAALSSRCRENGTKEKLHFTANVLAGFLRETRGQSVKSPQFVAGSFEARMSSSEERDFDHI